MKRLDQRGEGHLLIPFVISVILLVASIGFGGWAFMGRSDYKNNVDEKIAEAVGAAEEALSAKKDAEFAEKEKSPVRSYTGPAAYASVTFSYPKTWSAFIDEAATGNTVISGYFHPNAVPGLREGTNYALRMQVVEANYNTQLGSFSSSIKNGKVKVSPYSPAKVPTASGTRIEGEIISKKQGVMLLVPIRDKTLRVWTETNEYKADLDNIVLPSLTFAP